MFLKRHASGSISLIQSLRGPAWLQIPSVSNNSSISCAGILFKVPASPGRILRREQGANGEEWMGYGIQIILSQLDERLLHLDSHGLSLPCHLQRTILLSIGDSQQYNSERVILAPYSRPFCIQCVCWLGDSGRGWKSNFFKFWSCHTFPPGRHHIWRHKLDWTSFSMDFCHLE